MTSSTPLFFNLSNTSGLTSASISTLPFFLRFCASRTSHLIAVLERENLEKIAADLGLNMAEFKKALDTNEHKAKIEADSEAGKKAGIQGTPGFVINGYFLGGAQPYPAFKKLILRALKEAR